MPPRKTRRTPADLKNERKKQEPVCCPTCGINNFFAEFGCTECGTLLHPRLASNAMIPVESSNLEAIGHDPDSNTLHVQFRNGSLYAYHGVPVDVFEDMMIADSKGGFLSREIKGVYEYERVDQDAG